jgi:hypothetical protein
VGVRPDSRPPGKDGAGSAADIVEALAVAVDEAAFEAWAGLVWALCSKSEADAVRAWLSSRTVWRVGRDAHGLAIHCVDAFRADRVRELFGSVLRERGWRVVVAVGGSGVSAVG